MLDYSVFNLSNVTAPLTGTGFTAPVKLYNAYGFSLSAVCSGTLTGTVKLQACNDNPQGTGQLGTGVGQGVLALTGSSSPLLNWVDITSPVTTVAAVTGSVTQVWNYPEAMFGWVRGAFTLAANNLGTGSVSWNGITKGMR